MRPIILLDMDNTIMDFSGGIVKAYNSRYDDKITIDMLDTWDLEQTGAKHDINGIWKERGFFLNLDLLNDAADWVPKLAEKFNCYICSHSCSFYSEEKELSLKKNFGDLFEDKIIFAKDKFLVNGDVLLDDKLDNLAQFRMTGRDAVCYNSSYNRSWDGIRVHTMEEFYHRMNDLFRIRRGDSWIRR